MLHNRLKINVKGDSTKSFRVCREGKHLGLGCNTLLADAGYSSGENYHLLEAQNIPPFIPPHGTYKGGPEGFTYHWEEDDWRCPWGKKVTFRRVKVESKNNIKKKLYFTTRCDCKGCPYREGCIGKGHERKVEITYYREEYERVIARLNTRWGKRKKGLRQATVEPVLGTLLNFMGLRKINTQGLELAHKGMLVAAAAYNLQKLIRYTPKRSQAAVMALPRPQEKDLFRAKSIGWKGICTKRKCQSETTLELCNSYQC